MQNMAKNKRRSQRRSFSVPLIYQAGGAAFKSPAVDISDNGVFIRSDTPPNLGETIAIPLTLNHADGQFTMMGVGKIVRRREGKDAGMAVEFRSLFGTDPAMLSSLLKNLAPPEQHIEVLNRVKKKQKDGRRIAEPRKVSGWTEATNYFMACYVLIASMAFFWV